MNDTCKWVGENRKQLKNNLISNYVGAGKLNQQLSQLCNLHELTEGTFQLEKGWVLIVCMSNR